MSHPGTHFYHGIREKKIAKNKKINKVELFKAFGEGGGEGEGLWKMGMFQSCMAIRPKSVVSLWRQERHLPLSRRTRVAWHLSLSTHMQPPLKSFFSAQPLFYLYIYIYIFYKSTISSYLLLSNLNIFNEPIHF